MKRQIKHVVRSLAYNASTCFLCIHEGFGVFDGMATPMRRAIAETSRKFWPLRESGRLLHGICGAWPHPPCQSACLTTCAAAAGQEKWQNDRASHGLGWLFSILSFSGVALAETEEKSEETFPPFPTTEPTAPPGAWGVGTDVPETGRGSSPAKYSAKMYREPTKASRGSGSACHSVRVNTSAYHNSRTHELVSSRCRWARLRSQ